MTNSSFRILIAGALESLHFRRWCSQLRGMPFEFHLLATCAADPGFKDAYPGFAVHVPAARVRPQSLPVRVWRRLERMCGSRGESPFYDEERLAFFEKTLVNINPHVLHSHGLNVNWRNQMKDIHRVRRVSRSAGSGVWLYTTWGTDLDFYPRFRPEQEAIVRSILTDVDLMATECSRDLRLAREFGFRGCFWGMLPMFGGVDERLFRNHGETPSRRRLILVKGRDDQEKPGYEDPVGRARFILDAVEKTRDILAGHEIVVLQAGPRIAERVAALAEDGLAISAPGYFASYDDVMRLHARARAFFAMTVNDGLPSSLCEAMAAGALPVHSNLESVAEWVTDGENGILAAPDDVDAIAAAIRRVVTDDLFVGRAAARNKEIVAQRLGFEHIRRRVLQLYKDGIAMGDRRGA